MVIHELTSAECREVLFRSSLARLGCSRADQPYVVPVFCYFDVQEDCLYSFATLGKKIDWMRSNPKVCVEVSEISDQFHWTTVVVIGRYEEISDSPRDALARKRASELFHKRPEWWLPGTSSPASGAPRDTAVVYRVRIDSMTGRRTFRERV